MTKTEVYQPVSLMLLIIIAVLSVYQAFTSKSYDEINKDQIVTTSLNISDLESAKQITITEYNQMIAKADSANKIFLVAKGNDLIKRYLYRKIEY